MMKKFKTLLAATMALIFTLTSAVQASAFDEREITRNIALQELAQQFQSETFDFGEVSFLESDAWDAGIRITRIPEEERASFYDVRNFENANFVPGQVIVGFKPEPEMIETLSSEAISSRVSVYSISTDDNTYKLLREEELAEVSEFTEFT